MAEKAREVELIGFVCPYRNEVNLYVTNIPRSIEKNEAEVKLRKIFSKYGLIFEVQVVDSANSNIVEGGIYAFVKFYSVKEATTAKKEISGKWLLGDQFLKVQFANRKKCMDTPYPLHMSKCAQLANYYFGFNGWCTSVIKMEECPHMSSGEGSQQTPVFMFTCTVRLEITACDCYCDGIGYGGDRNVVEKEQDPARRLQLMGYSKKLAHRHAYENAFKRVLIIVTGSGRVGVEINQTDTYECDLKGFSHKQGTVQVNHIDAVDERDSDDAANSL